MAKIFRRTARVTLPRRRAHRGAVPAALFCLSNLAILWLAVRWAAAVSARRLDFAVGLAALFPLCAMLAVLAGGLAGHLFPVAVTAGVAIAAVAAGWLGARAPFALLRGTEAPRGWFAWCAAGVALAFAIFPVVRVLTAGTGYFIDDFGYHAVAVASWLKHGDFRQIMPQFTAYLPLNAELLAAWFALPFHHDAMVVLAGTAWILLAATAAAGLARLTRCSGGASLVTAAAILAAPTTIWQTRTFSACDLAGTAMLLAGLYFAIAAIRNQRLAQALVAGLLAGLAAGTKATYLPVAGIICLYPLGAPLPWRSRVQFTAVLLLATAALGSVWYLRNGLATGNPLFPAQLRPFAGPLTKAEQVDIKLAGQLAKIPWTWRLWGSMARDYLAWPLPFGLLAAAGYGRAVVAELQRGAEEAAPRRLLAIGGFAQFALHFFAPFCLGGYADGRLEVYPRYIMPWFTFGLVLAAPLLDGRTPLPWRCLWRALALAGFVICWPRAGVMLGGGAALALSGLALWRWLPARAWRPIAVTGLAGVWPALALLEPRLHAVSERNLRENFRTRLGHPIGPAIFALEELPPGTRVTRFANHAYFNEPIYGRSWQLEPVFTGADGRPLLPLHEQFRAHPELTFFAVEPPVQITPAQLVENLKAAGIRAVLVTRYDAETWPPQQALLETSGQATALFQDEDSALWQLR